MKLAAEVEAEEADEDNDNDDNGDDQDDVKESANDKSCSSCDDDEDDDQDGNDHEIDEEDDNVDDSDNASVNDDGVEDDEEEREFTPSFSNPSGRRLARLQGTPLVEYESDSAEERGNLEDGYASDDDDDDVSEVFGPSSATALKLDNLVPGLFLDHHTLLSRRRPALNKIARPSTPPISMIPDSSDFVCGTMDEDKPIEAAYFSALDEHARLHHKLCPQDIDPSFPEEPDSDEENDSHHSDHSHPICRSPPPPVHRSPPTCHKPIDRYSFASQRTRQQHQAFDVFSDSRAASFQHNRTILIKAQRSKRRERHQQHVQEGDAMRLRRGAIDIVIGLENKNRRRRERRHHAKHQVAPGEGVEKMRQLGMIALKSKENPHAEWMLSI
ncbi:uncharacterized protein V1518DRAFT_416300 [Limtongia smithiae]|uniref:uncharacterized protein n=1 Tax=Limtongia smithiae TaxID=1125753 RepID=UPI0034CF631C